MLPLTSADVRTSERSQTRRPKEDTSRIPELTTRATQSVTAAYISWHKRGQTDRIRTLEPSALVEVAQNARLYTLDNILDWLIQDILSISKDALRDEDYTPALQSVLSAIAERPRTFANRDVNAVFAAFVHSHQQDAPLLPLSAPVMGMVLNSIAQAHESLAKSFDDVAVLQALICCLESLQPAELTAMELYVFRYLFRLAIYLLHEKYDSLVLRLVQVLVKAEIIPASIASAHDDVPNDFRVIAVSLLMRSCIHHKWNDVALELLKNEDLRKPGLEKYYTSLVNNLVTASIHYPHVCSNIIVGALLSNPALRISERALAAFFAASLQANNYLAAKDAYAALRSARVREHVRYEFPSSPVVTWMLDNIIASRYDRVIGKVLARHILSAPMKIALYDRANIIGSCARAGYCNEAEELWKYFTMRAGGELISGNASCMLDIVKNFNSIRLDLELVAACPAGDGTAIAATLDKFTAILYAEYCPLDSSTFPIDVPGTSAVGFDCEVVENDFYDTSRLPDDPTVIFGQIPEDYDREFDAGKFQQAKRLNDFAFQVFSAFQASKRPLRRASHYDLNALARAANELGLVRQSMTAMRTLMGRKEVPDVRDLNVVISATAKRSPTQAEKMVLQLASEGLPVDGLLLSTLIHEALDRDDLALANRVFVLAIDFLSVSLPGAAGHRLLEAWLGSRDKDVAAEDGGSGEGTTLVARRLSSAEEKDVLRAYMTNALILFEVGDPKGTLQRRHLAQCIAACLRIEDGALAFRFWRLKQAQRGWKLETAEALREAIAHQLEVDASCERIGQSDATEMLLELRPKELLSADWRELGKTKEGE